MWVNIKLVKIIHSIPLTTEGTLCTVFHVNWLKLHCRNRYDLVNTEFETGTSWKIKICPTQLWRRPPYQLGL